MADKPLIIGHRGASAIAPENTIAAFRLALAAGADGVEFDVRLTRDGIPVVIHDDNLKRTGSLPQTVASLSLAELKQVDVGSWFNRTQKRSTSDFSGEKIPTLEEVFELFESTDAVLYLEMKSDAIQRDQLAAVCCESLRERSFKVRVIVECFDLTGLEAVKRIDPEIKTAALFDFPQLPSWLVHSGRRMIQQALAAGADEIALHQRLASQQVVETAKAAGLKVVVWTVDDKVWVKRAQSCGIDALITNDPGLMILERSRMRTV
ncbi:MAG TPA: glycerophosphodiester phosphodiesterase family protein [Pyrinomonadaceae bacterium]|jgi:glycerophosphoryl diester phosphodiesterase|nr:glycerophosphodiester phosphodiesterase family protein [Pyrinomonadaceae bacterium]